MMNNIDPQFLAIRRSLTNQAPTPEGIENIEAIRAQAIALAHYITHFAPSCRERSLALTHLEETVMWAVKGIVLAPLLAKDTGVRLVPQEVTAP